nr:5-deoxy-glucuronate isomerase [Isoptericola variabilis]
MFPVQNSAYCEDVVYLAKSQVRVGPCCEVHEGDVAPVPHGYHGTCVAAPGYDTYDLNVMAGPNECLVQFAPDDPAHHWIRATWVHQEEAPPPHGQVRKPRKAHPPATKPTRDSCA